MINIEPKIVNVNKKMLIGHSLDMSMSDNKTQQLWQSFMPRLKEINPFRVNSDLVSMQVYEDYYDFQPHSTFTKWATAEVSDFKTVPDGMKTLELESGLYAVFHYIGSSSDKRIFEYIFASWLPKSQYQVDNRPHFEVLGEKYNNVDSNSEEHIYIPIKLKK